MTDTKTPLQILEEGRTLIADPDRWIQREYARRRPDGVECFCSDGALLKADGVEMKYADDGEMYDWKSSPKGSSPEMTKARRILSDTAAIMGTDAYRDTWIVGYNDKHTHEEVLELWDAAIVEAKRLQEA